MDKKLLSALDTELDIQRRLLEKVKERREELQNKVLRGDSQAGRSLKRINKVLKKIDR